MSACSVTENIAYCDVFFSSKGRLSTKLSQLQLYTIVHRPMYVDMV